MLCQDSVAVGQNSAGSTFHSHELRHSVGKEFTHSHTGSILLQSLALGTVKEGCTDHGQREGSDTSGPGKFRVRVRPGPTCGGGV